MGVHSEFLYLMGGVAKFRKGNPFSAVTIMDAFDKADAKGPPYYGDDRKDHYWIAYGIDAYNAQ